jgi:hypothetical protein
MDDETFRALTDRATVVLESLDVEHYYGGPCVADEAIGSVGRAMARGTPEQRADFSTALTPHARRVLGRFMLRAPMLALRQRDGSVLHDGLLVRVLVEQRVRDWRDDLVAFAPYHYAAQELGQSPVDLFDDAALCAVPELATVMQTFGRRQDVTLGAFGWRRIETPEGPTLEMLGLKAQPTGAVVGNPSWDTVNGAMVRDLLAWVESQRHATRSNQG